MAEDGAMGEEQALALRHAIEREQLRLERVATDEVRRIRKTVGSCVRCTAKLWTFDGVVISFRPQYCSPACDQADRPTPQSPQGAWSPWTTDPIP